MDQIHMLTVFPAERGMISDRTTSNHNIVRYINADLLHRATSTALSSHHISHYNHGPMVDDVRSLVRYHMYQIQLTSDRVNLDKKEFIQLSKLEELHRDINTAAVRAVLAFNDAGWDANGFLPRLGTSLSRFDRIGAVEEPGGGSRPMTVEELEKKLAVAKEVAVFAETELRETMDSMQSVRPFV